MKTDGHRTPPPINRRDDIARSLERPRSGVKQRWPGQRAAGGLCRIYRRFGANPTVQAFSRRGKDIAEGKMLAPSPGKMPPASPPSPLSVGIADRRSHQLATLWSLCVLPVRWPRRRYQCATTMLKPNLIAVMLYSTMVENSPAFYKYTVNGWGKCGPGLFLCLCTTR